MSVCYSLEIVSFQRWEFVLSLSFFCLVAENIEELGGNDRFLFLSWGFQWKILDQNN